MHKQQQHRKHHDHYQCETEHHKLSFCREEDESMVPPRFPKPFFKDDSVYMKQFEKMLNEFEIQYDNFNLTYLIDRIKKLQRKENSIRLFNERLKEDLALIVTNTNNATCSNANSNANDVVNQINHLIREKKTQVESKNMFPQSHSYNLRSTSKRSLSVITNASISQSQDHTTFCNETNKMSTSINSILKSTTNTNSFNIKRKIEILKNISFSLDLTSSNYNTKTAI